MLFKGSHYEDSLQSLSVILRLCNTFDLDYSVIPFYTDSFWSFNILIGLILLSFIQAYGAYRFAWLFQIN